MHTSPRGSHRVMGDSRWGSVARREVEAKDAIPVRVKLAGRHESEALVEAAGLTIPHPMAGEQLGRPLGTDEANDLVDDRATDAAALVTLIHEELPQEPGTGMG